MSKETFGTILPKELEEKFRDKALSQGKQLNLALEEAMKLWLLKKTGKNTQEISLNSYKKRHK